MTYIQIAKIPDEKQVPFHCLNNSLLVPIYAQHSLPIVTNFKQAYHNETRRLTGKPGKNYWQNTADYDIAVKFEPETRLLSGKIRISYKNNSPDTLKQLVFKLYPNLYQYQSLRNTPIAAEDLTGGVRVEDLQFQGYPVPSKHQRIRGTNMLADSIKIPPAKTSKIEMRFSYELNKGSFNRTGQLMRAHLSSPIFSHGLQYMTIWTAGTCTHTLAKKSFTMISEILR